jgi:hypothetical protein
MTGVTAIIPCISFPVFQVAEIQAWGSFRPVAESRCALLNK